MPQLVTFKGKPVKRRWELPGGRLGLLLVHPEPGQAGEKLEVSQQDWDRDGKVTYFAPGQLPDLRALARQAHTT